jgi:hypothetical protein
MSRIRRPPQASEPVDNDAETMPVREAEDFQGVEKRVRLPALPAANLTRQYLPVGLPP